MIYRRTFAVSIFLTLVVSLFLSSISPRVAIAKGGGFSRSVAGTYLLVEETGSKRLITVTEDGNFLTVAQSATVFGFSDAQGAWQRSADRRDDEKMTARTIDFGFDLNDGTATGVSRIDYIVTFADEVDGKFQAVSGTYSGKTFAPDQDPLNPTEPPIRTFNATFTGQRVTGDGGD